MLKIVYWIVSVGSLGVLLLEAPSGSLMTATPERGKVSAVAAGAGATVRGGPAFVWIGGSHGYRGGK